MTCWAILQSLARAGHETHLVCLQDPYDTTNTPDRLKLVEPLVKNIIILHVPVPQQINGVFKKLMNESMTAVFPSLLLRDKTEKLLNGLRPDVIFNYHWTAAAATFGYRSSPKMTITGDLAHRPEACRWFITKPTLSAGYAKNSVCVLLRSRLYKRGMIQLLNESDDAGSFGYHDAMWLKKHGDGRSRYVLTPIMDMAGPTWRNKRSSQSGGKFKIIAGISNLQSTSTSSALRLIATDILPRLEKELGENFEIHIIGQGTPPPELNRLLPRPSIKMRGYVPSVDPEHRSADLLLSPTPIFLGFRVRIIMGFSYGLCVVAHKNEAINMPEMMHQKNALLADNGKDLADAVIMAYKSAELRRRLGDAARQTYENYFEGNKTGMNLVKEIETLSLKNNTSSRI